MKTNLTKAIASTTTGVCLALGLLSGCSGTDADLSAQEPSETSEAADVEAPTDIPDVAMSRGAADTQTQQAEDGSLAEPTETETQELVPFAEIDLGGDHTVGFIQIGDGVLIAEMAPAYTQSALEFDSDGNMVLSAPDLWAALTDDPLPNELVEFREFAGSGQPELELGDDGVEIIQVPEEISEPLSALEGPGVIEKAGCGNGCCDYAWLSTFTECQGGHSGSWFSFSTSWHDSGSRSNVWYWAGMLCSGTGTSQWEVKISKNKYSYPVPRGYFSQLVWNQGCNYGWCGRTVRVKANSENAPVYATHCGFVVKELF